MSSATDPVISMPGELKTLSVCSHHENLMKSLHKLQQDGQMCDILLITEDGDMPAHMAVLNAASNYFMMKINSILKNSEPAKTYNLHLQNMDFDLLTRVVHYIYTGKVSLDGTTASSLQSAFESLGLDDAAQVCQQYISGKDKGFQDNEPTPDHESGRVLEKNADNCTKEDTLPALRTSSEDSEMAEQGSTGNISCFQGENSKHREGSLDNVGEKESVSDKMLDKSTCDSELENTGDHPGVVNQGVVDASVQTDDIPWPMELNVVNPTAQSRTRKNRRKGGRPRKVVVDTPGDLQIIGTSETPTGRKRGRPKKNPADLEIKTEEVMEMDQSNKANETMENTLSDLGLEVVNASAAVTSFDFDPPQKQGMELRKRTGLKSFSSVPDEMDEDLSNDHDEEMDIIARVYDEDKHDDEEKMMAERDFEIDDIDPEWQSQSDNIKVTSTPPRRGKKRGPKPKSRPEGSKKKYFYTGLDCTKCGQSFPTTQQKRIHKKQCKEKGFHKDCHQCGFHSENRDEMLAHRTTHSRERKRQNWKRYSEVLKSKHMCTVCGKGFTLEWVKFSHMYCKHNIPLEENGKFPVLYCDVPECKYRSLQQYLVDYHKRNRHGGSKDFICELCGTSFAHRFYLNTHIKNKHSSAEGVYPCEICGKQVTSLSSLKLHKKFMHGSDPWLQCEKCDFSTKYRDTFESHQHKKHGIPLPDRRNQYKCDHCPYTSMHKNAFNSHMRRHRGEKPFKCPECSKTFSSKSECTNHQKWHDKGNRVHCPYEGCKFSSVIRQTVDFHVRVMHTHKHEKPWICHICDYCTNVKGNLKLHLRKVHKLVVPKRQSLVISPDQIQEKEREANPTPKQVIPASSSPLSEPQGKGVGMTESNRIAGIQYTLADISYPGNNASYETPHPLSAAERQARPLQFHQTYIEKSGPAGSDSDYHQQVPAPVHGTDLGCGASQTQQHTNFMVQNPSSPALHQGSQVSQPMSLVNRPTLVRHVESTPPPRVSPTGIPSPHHPHLRMLSSHPGHADHHPPVNSPPPNQQSPIPASPSPQQPGSVCLPPSISPAPSLQLQRGDSASHMPANLQQNADNQNNQPYNVQEAIMNYMYMSHMQ